MRPAQQSGERHDDRSATAFVRADASPVPYVIYLRFATRHILIFYIVKVRDMGALTRMTCFF